MKFSQFSADMANHLFPGQRTYQDNILGLAGSDETESVSASGACDPNVPITLLTISGTKAYTLADGKYFGQKKCIACASASGSPAGTLTITTPSTTTGYVPSSTFFFDTAGQCVDLVWLSGGWIVERVCRAGGAADNVVVGTTVLTSKNLWAIYGLSVTNTVSSTGANALPNGSAVGEICLVVNTTVSGTPVGNLDGVYLGMTGAAYTHMGTIGVAASTTVTGDYAKLRWTGTAWQVLDFSGITWS